MKNQVTKFILFFVVASILIILDQFTKQLAFKYLFNQEPKVIIKDVFELVYTENRGAAFGVLQGKQTFFYIITVIVLIVLLVFVFKIELSKHNILLLVIIDLIFSGAVGNFIDRVKNQYVIDFLYFKPIDFPVFNLADSYITIGCILMVLSMFTIYKDKEVL